MKKVLLIFLLISVVTLSFAVPAMANAVVETEQMKVIAEQEVVPFSEQTQIFYRTYNGRLQFRVWGVISARWLTPWTNV
jgi:hypothetical protein